jgi:signal transduction histidine kinase
MSTPEVGRAGRAAVPPWAPFMSARLLAAIGGLAIIASLSWLWNRTRSVPPEEHARIDAALHELRSLDRTVNQDVLRARYQVIDSYDPLRRSYRRIQELEAVIAAPPLYLSGAFRKQLSVEVARYRAAVTTKQRLIEDFKYRILNLKELLAYLPEAGVGVAKAASSESDDRLAADVNRTLQQMLLHNLTSDESYAETVRAEVNALDIAGRQARTYLVKRRVRTLVLNIRTLLAVKPEVDRNLLRILDLPIKDHEDNVAAIYSAGHATAERIAGRYRVLLYSFCLALLLMVSFGVLRLRRTAHALETSKDRLEARVAERRHDLDARNRELAAVLDNVGQALFTVDLDGRLSRKHSAALDRWFGDAAGGEYFWDVLQPISADAALWASIGWEQLREGTLPVDVALDQLPRRLLSRGRHYGIEYRTVGGPSGLASILVVITDVTESIERARSEASQREQLALFLQLTSGRGELLEFFTECERLAESVIGGALNGRAETLRALHTLKGNCAMRDLGSMVSVCHALEEKLADGGDDLDAADRALLATTWSSLADRVRALTGRVADDRVELSRAELQAIREEIAAGERFTDPQAILARLDRLEREPAARRLDRVADDARRLARRLGKEELVVTVESDDIRLDRRRWASFWSGFVHMLRNALDHGLESPEERVATGKARAGRLSLRARQIDDQVVIEIGDDGRGIDWDAVRERARQLGRPARSQAELLEALLEGGLSTKIAATEMSGRGTGVSACRSACAALGGDLSVSTARGHGTTFRFTIPLDDAAPRPSATSGTPAAPATPAA